MVASSGWKKFGIVVLFLAPSLAALLMFSLGPMIGTSWVSLHEWNLIRPAEFIGFDNDRALCGDEKCHQALRNTLYYLAGYMPLVPVGGRALTFFVHGPDRRCAYFMALHFLPAFLSGRPVPGSWNGSARAASRCRSAARKGRDDRART